MLKKFLMTLAIVTVLGASACSSKKQKEDEGSIPNAAADENTLGDSDSGKAAGLQTVHYGFDSSTLDEAAKGILKANSQILKDKPALKVQIEGHCDRKGGIQYNIALGEKRANAAKKFMEDQGVADDRITTVSYGKERPVDPAETEEADAKNRRCNFAITSK